MWKYGLTSLLPSKTLSCLTPHSVDPLTRRKMRGADGKQNITPREIMLIFEDTIREIKEELGKDSRSDLFLGAKVSVLAEFVTPAQIKPSRSYARHSKPCHRRISTRSLNTVLPLRKNSQI